MKRLVLAFVALVASALAVQGQDTPQTVKAQIDNFSGDIARLETQYENVASLISQCLNSSASLKTTYATPVAEATAMGTGATDLSLQVLKAQSDSCVASAATLDTIIQGIAGCIAIIQDKGVAASLTQLQAMYPAGTTPPAPRSILNRKGFKK